MKRYIVIDKKGDFCFEGTEIDLKEYMEETFEVVERLNNSADFLKEYSVYETSGRLRLWELKL